MTGPGGLLRTVIVVVAALGLAGLVACQSAETKQRYADARQRAIEHQALPPPSDYVLHPGDVVSIKFFYNPELNEQKLPVRPDGKTSLQLVGDVQAAGLTVPQLQDRLAERYAGVIKHPEVTVIVHAFAAERVYVGGEVMRPGVIERSPGLTAGQAIIAAGGHTNKSEMKNVVIVRDQGTEEPMLMMVDLKDGMKSLSGYLDVPLQPRDMVFVPMSTIAELNQFVDQYIDKMIPIARNFNIQYNFGALGVQ